MLWVTSYMTQTEEEGVRAVIALGARASMTGGEIHSWSWVSCGENGGGGGDITSLRNKCAEGWIGKVVGKGYVDLGTSEYFNVIGVEEAGVG